MRRALLRVPGPRTLSPTDSRVILPPQTVRLIWKLTKLIKLTSHLSLGAKLVCQDDPFRFN